MYTVCDWKIFVVQQPKPKKQRNALQLNADVFYETVCA